MATKTKKAKRTIAAEAKIVDTKTTTIQLSQIVSNTAQSRGMGVLYYLKDLGYGLFEKETVDKDPIWTMLFSDKPEDQAHACSLIEDNEPEIVALWQALSSSTQLQPIGVVELDDNAYDIVFGMRRAIALAYGFAKTGKNVPVEAKVFIYDGVPTEVQLRLMALDENDARAPESPIDRAMTYKWLADQGMSPADIGKRYKIKGKPQTDQNIRNYLKLLHKKLEDKLVDIHTGKLGVDPALKILDARLKDKPDPTRSSKGDGKRYRMPGSKGLIKIYNSQKKPAKMEQEEWALWTTADVRKLLALRLGLKFTEYVAPPPEPDTSHEGNGKGGGGKKVVLPVTRKRAIALLEALGKTTASTWDDDLLKDKLENIVNIVEDDGPEVKDESLSKLLKKLTDGYANGQTVKITK